MCDPPSHQSPSLRYFQSTLHCSETSEIHSTKMSTRLKWHATERQHGERDTKRQQTSKTVGARKRASWKNKNNFQENWRSLIRNFSMFTPWHMLLDLDLILIPCWVLPKFKQLLLLDLTWPQFSSRTWWSYMDVRVLSLPSCVAFVSFRPLFTLQM